MVRLSKFICAGMMILAITTATSYTQYGKIIINRNPKIPHGIQAQAEIDWDFGLVNDNDKY